MTIITLNSELTDESPRLIERDPKHLSSRNDLLVHSTVPMFNMSNSGLFGLLSYCYSYHKNVVINPTDMWNTFLSQLTIAVSKNADKYRALFTESDKKETISVPTDSFHELPVSLVIHELKKLVKFDVDLILTEFSTDTEMSREVSSHIFLDMASPYYDYSMFCCGIRSIKIGGTTEDWEKAYKNAMELLTIFDLDNDKFQNWRASCLTIMTSFLNATKNDYDVDFFKDIFTQKNVGSGRQLEINGWFTNIFYDIPSFKKIDNFCAPMGKVEYKNTSTGKNYVMYSGAFSHVEKDGFLELEYSKHIFEKNAK